MTSAVLGIIGGSGIYDLPGLENVRDEAIESPWGEPSAAVTRGVIAGLPIVFLPRHGKGHEGVLVEWPGRLDHDARDRAVALAGDRLGLQWRRTAAAAKEA